MVVRINNLSKWLCLQSGETLALAGDQLRKIRVEVNCPVPTRFDVVEGDGDNPRSTFLAVVQGLEVLEYSAEAFSRLVPTSEDEVWFYTSESEDVTIESFEASFTTIASRRTRNPELERMMHKLEQNMNARIAVQAAETAELRSRLEAQGIDPDTGEDLNDDGDAASVAAAAAAEAEAASAAELAAKGQGNGAA